jgi:hypothetical protein
VDEKKIRGEQEMKATEVLFNCLTGPQVLEVKNCKTVQEVFAEFD